MTSTVTGLFGLDNSNRDFTKAKAWGKNQFNSSFPAALSCYLHNKNLAANYLAITNKHFGVTSIAIETLFAINPQSPDIYFSFETQYLPFQKYIIGTLPRTDLVILNSASNACLRGLEVKLTALPDNTTCNLKDAQFGSEIVVRPDSIVYLAASLASADLPTISRHIKGSGIRIDDWTDAEEVIQHIKAIIACITAISLDLEAKQSPFLLQPIWKTQGKSAQLADNCLDVFAWSDTAFAWFIAQLSKFESITQKITRQTRTSIWLYKMLLDIVTQGRFDPDITKKLSYNTRNDKAFASAGNITNKYMTCDNLITPRISKNDIKHIILGGGQDLLSPERRFDAIIFNSPELFL
jgi:type II restriction enzyme